MCSSIYMYKVIFVSLPKEERKECARVRRVETRSPLILPSNRHTNTPSLGGLSLIINIFGSGLTYNSHSASRFLYVTSILEALK